MPIRLSETLNLDGVRLENQTSGVSNPPADTVQLINDDEIITVQTPGGLTKTLAEFEDSGAVNVDPDANRDFHQVGAVFINGVTDTAFICTDNTASSAVWHRQVDHVTDTTDPGAGDDSYPVGTLWVNTTDNRVWQCTDNTTSAAVWVATSIETGVELTASSAQSIPNDTWTTADFDTEVNDTDGYYDNATSATDVTVPFDGIITVTIKSTWASGSTGLRFQRIRKNGTTTLLDQSFGAVSFGTYTMTWTGKVNSGDVLTMEVRHTQGAALNLNSAVMDMYMIRAVSN